MTHRNDKRNNRHNRQRNNKTELSPFASMFLGALLGKCTEMIAKKMAEEAKKKTPDIHAEGITNKDINNINNGNATLYKLRIPADGSAVEYPIPDGLSFFFDEEGKLMVHKKIEGDAETPDDKKDNPITYDDILRELYFNKTAYWVSSINIEHTTTVRGSYNDINNCASEAQCKRMVAFNKLQNIAKYLNKGWKPDFPGSNNYTICKNYAGGYSLLGNRKCQAGAIYFRTKDLANEAIRLMGDESLNDLFSTDW